MPNESFHWGGITRGQVKRFKGKAKEEPSCDSRIFANEFPGATVLSFLPSKVSS